MKHRHKGTEGSQHKFGGDGYRRMAKRMVRTS